MEKGGKTKVRIYQRYSKKIFRGTSNVSFIKAIDSNGSP
jgi:hypothetical protein